MTIIKAGYFASLLGFGAMLTATGAMAQSVAPPNNADMRVQVSQFRFTGNTALSSAELASVLKMFPGRALSMAELNRAAEEVQALYRAKGWFLARAYLPPQDPKDGVVEIAILEGRIDKVKVVRSDGAPISEGAAKAMADASLRPGQLITDHGIEHPLLLLRDIPRVSAKSTIEPGSAVGTADVTINVDTDPGLRIMSGRVELDNYGTHVTGRTRLTGELNVNNPYGIGDQLSVRAFIANAHGNTFGRASYSLPVGPYGTRIGATLAHLSYQLGDEFAALGPTGVANVASLNASHPILRSKNVNLQAGVVVERKRLTDKIEITNTREQSRLNQITGSLSGDWRDSEVSVNQASLSLSNGKLTYDDPLRNALDQSPQVGLHQAGTFTKAVLTARRTHQFTSNLQAMVSLNVQTANKNLPGAEKFALGGSSNVRAFPISEVIGDQGYATTLEAQYALAGLSNASCMSAATAFYDFGKVTINHNNPVGMTGYTKRAIGGPGVGLNVDCVGGLMIRISIATPTQGDLPGNSGTRGWIMAGYGF